MANGTHAAIPLPEKLSNPAKRAFEAAGIHSLNDIQRFTQRELLALHGVGPASIPTLRAALEAHGLDFAPAKPAR
jgi:sulfite reductase beta subunit-like hemoprotein